MDTSHREELKTILLDLSKDQKMFEGEVARIQMYNRLEQLYRASDNGTKFRHFYSDIFDTLIRITLNPELGQIDILGQNLSIIQEKYPEDSKLSGKDRTDVINGINKLYDHVNLDITRIHYSDLQSHKLSQNSEINTIKDNVNEISVKLQDGIQKLSQIDELSERIETATSESKKAQKEYIAILGIFSAVALTFTSGIVFTGSVLQNIGSASIYRLLFVSLLIGLVLFNSLYIMFHYIDRLVHGEKQRTVKPLVIPNCIMVGLIVLILLSWCSGVAEKRNKKVENIVNQPIETVIPSPAPSENNEAIPSYMPSQIPVETD